MVAMLSLLDCTASTSKTVKSFDLRSNTSAWHWARFKVEATSKRFLNAKSQLRLHERAKHCHLHSRILWYKSALSLAKE